jgi:hypothetical protein
MELEDIPEIGPKFPEKICICITKDSKQKLDILKKSGKDTGQLFRMLLDDFLKTIDFDSAG